jgi:hypothetical protein
MYCDRIPDTPDWHCYATAGDKINVLPQKESMYMW